MTVEEIKISITIKNEEGLHARPGAKLVQLIKDMDCDVYMANEDGEEVDAKSVLGVLMLAAERGAVMNLRASGQDAQKAIDAICSVLLDEEWTP